MKALPAHTRFAAILLTAPLVALLALTGCAGPDDVVVLPIEEPPKTLETDKPEDETDDAALLTECLTDRVWSLDVMDLAGQLQALMQANGTPVTSITSSDEMTMLFDSNTQVSVGMGVTFTMLMKLPDGRSATGILDQSGFGEGEWALAANSVSNVAFDPWVDKYARTMKVAVDGTTIVVPLEVPDIEVAGTTMTVDCYGDFMNTTSPDSPFTHRWEAITP